MNEFGISGEYVITDRTGQLILTGYGDILTFRSTELFRDENFSLPEDASYIATYSYMTEIYGTDFKKFDFKSLCKINIKCLRSQADVSNKLLASGGPTMKIF